MKKLTKQQNMVINCLQNGWEVITDSEIKGAIIATNKYEFKISSRLFWNLVDLELIRQNGPSKNAELEYRYMITPKGLSTKTKDVQQAIFDSLERLP